jgi:hypothetical protein
MKTSELTEAALDWAVAKCEGPNSVAACYYDEDDLPMCRDEAQHMEWQPSTNWAQGGPIIEREGMGMWMYQWNEEGEPEVGWYAEDKDGNHVRTGPTPLIAAMRCYVASKAVELDLPEELK